MMKVLWITNEPFPEAERLLIGKGESRGTGGWVLGAAHALLKQSRDIELYVSSVSRLVDRLTVLSGEKIKHYIIPFGKGRFKYNSEYEPYWVQIKNAVKPNVIHIHGTEYSHALAFINACGSSHVVVSLQGVKSGIAPFYSAGLTFYDVYRNITLREIIRGSIYKEQKRFYQSAQIEKEILCKVDHIIGRTSWDKAHSWAINPKAQYHFCNETLRYEFYDGSRWRYETCHKHMIFLSQAGYPLKGLHQVLNAMPLILKHYPNACIYVAGADITRYETLQDKVRISGYGKYVRRIIRRLQIGDHIKFLGPLNAEQMKQVYLNSNVFVCPSSIENSPNSLGEAQILGVPCVASYVGGVADMMIGNEENLYRFEEVTLLAEKICRIFDLEDKHIDMTHEAMCRHNPVDNTQRLIQIYNEVMK